MVPECGLTVHLKLHQPSPWSMTEESELTRTSSTSATMLTSPSAPITTHSCVDSHNDQSRLYRSVSSFVRSKCDNTLPMVMRRMMLMSTDVLGFLRLGRDRDEKADAPVEDGALEVPEVVAEHRGIPDIHLCTVSTLSLGRGGS